MEKSQSETLWEAKAALNSFQKHVLKTRRSLFPILFKRIMYLICNGNHRKIIPSREHQATKYFRFEIRTREFI